MLWYERPFLAVLRREYPGAMRSDEPRTGRYLEALRREIRLYHDADFRVGDVYVGAARPR